jgi:hypothetical protein
MKPVRAHLLWDNLDDLHPLENHPRKIGALEPVILDSRDIRRRLRTIRECSGDDTVAVVNEPPDLRSSAIEAEMLSLECYAAHGSFFTERPRSVTRRHRSSIANRSAIAGFTASGLLDEFISRRQERSAR